MCLSATVRSYHDINTNASFTWLHLRVQCGSNAISSITTDKLFPHALDCCHNGFEMMISLQPHIIFIQYRPKYRKGETSWGFTQLHYRCIVGVGIHCGLCQIKDRCFKNQYMDDSIGITIYFSRCFGSWWFNCDPHRRARWILKIVVYRPKRTNLFNIYSWIVDHRHWSFWIVW